MRTEKTLQDIIGLLEQSEVYIRCFKKNSKWYIDLKDSGNIYYSNNISDLINPIEDIFMDKDIHKLDYKIIEKDYIFRYIVIKLLNTKIGELFKDTTLHNFSTKVGISYGIEIKEEFYSSFLKPREHISCYTLKMELNKLAGEKSLNKL